MQLSAVSRRFAEAVFLVPSLKLGLTTRPHDDEWEEVDLSSSFALKCAKLICCLKVAGQSFNASGWPGFVAAASQVTSVEMKPQSTLQAAQADLLLSFCSHNLTELSLWGTHVPAMLPPSLTKLHVFFSPPERCGGDFTQPDALLYHAARLQHLTELIISFSPHGAPGPVLLTSPIQLPCLKFLYIEHVALNAPELDLSWVLQQPCQDLWVDMIVDTADLAKHADAVEQLRQVPLTTLSLHLTMPFTSAMQAIWSQLTLQHLRMTVSSPSVFSQDTEPLQALPHGCMCLFVDASDRDLANIYISWPALTRRGVRIELQLADAHLHVLGDAVCPDHLEEPWQFSVLSAGGMHGLPQLPNFKPAAAADAQCIMVQNSAACDAGWT